MEAARLEGVGQRGEPGVLSFETLVNQAVNSFEAVRTPSFTEVTDGEFVGLSEPYRQMQELEARLRQMQEFRDGSRDEVIAAVNEERKEAREPLYTAVRESLRQLEEAKKGLNQLLEQRNLDPEKFLASNEGRPVQVELNNFELVSKTCLKELETYDLQTAGLIDEQYQAKIKLVEATLEQLKNDYRGSDAQKHDNWVLLERERDDLLTKPTELFSAKNVQTIYQRFGLEEGDTKIQELWAASREAIKQEIEAEQFGKVLEGFSWQFYDGRVAEEAKGSELVKALDKDMRGWDEPKREAVYEAFESYIRSQESREDTNSRLADLPNAKKYLESKVAEKVAEVLEQKSRYFQNVVESIEKEIFWGRKQCITSELDNTLYQRGQVEAEDGEALRLDEGKRQTQREGFASVQSVVESLQNVSGKLEPRQYSSDAPVVILAEREEVASQMAQNRERIGEVDERIKGLSEDAKQLGIGTEGKGLKNAIVLEIESETKKLWRLPSRRITSFLNRRRNERIEKLTEVRDGLNEYDSERAEIVNGNTSLQNRLSEIQKEERTIREKLGNLPAFVKLDVLRRNQTDLSEAFETLVALKQELWGEPGYTTPPALAQISTQVEVLKKREQQLRSFADLTGLPFGLEREPNRL